MIILFMVLIPIITGLLIPILKLNNVHRNIYVLISTFVVSCIAFYSIFTGLYIDITFFKLNNIFLIGFKNDGLSRFFTIILAMLWPFATLYATEYMEHEENRDSFFRYYLIAFGIALGLAHSRNLITMYLFYELLTFLTLPLVMHKLEEKESLYAGKIYLILSILGATIALIGIIIYSSLIGSVEFIYDGFGSLDVVSNVNLLYVSYILMFIGFGVKAAIIPFSFWLPLCSCAPTPVSALLHAVAVVKSGVFCIIRVTYFSFGASFLKDSFAQTIVIVITLITILYGSIMALKNKHIKRILAYSTVSNLSYILFAVSLMSSAGLYAGLTHMIFHAIIKINLFFAAGSIMIYSKKEYVDDIKGIAKKMPITMICFLISSLALIGVPLTCGFISKFQIAVAAVNDTSLISKIGLICIIISAILTVFYLFKIIMPAFSPNKDFDYKTIENVKESKLAIQITLISITIIIIFFGINSIGLLNYIELISKGMI